MARFDLHAAFFGGPGFTLYHAWGPNSALPLAPHFHDEYLICAQLRGVEECHVSGKLQEFTPGDVVLINPHQVHTGNATHTEELEYISLYVDREVVRKFAESVGAATDAPEFTQVRVHNDPVLVHRLEELLALVRERDTSNLYPYASAPSEDDVEPMSRLLSSRQVAPASGASGGAGEAKGEAKGGVEGEDARGGKKDAEGPRRQPVTAVMRGPELAQVAERLALESALNAVLAQAFESFSNLRRPMLRSSNRVGHRKIARVIEHLRALPPAQAATQSLDELAEISELSKFHFLRQFSQVIGMTPGAYVRTLRLCHAARKLRTSDLPILDIALSVGFSDHPSFSRAFARHMGMTPSEYQNLGPL